MNFKLPVYLLATVLLGTSCSKKAAVVATPAPATASSAISASTILINSEVEKFGQLAPSATFNSNALTVATWWDDATIAQLCDERVDGCNTKASGRDYVSIQLNPNAVRQNGSSINVFGRLKGGLGVICALGEAVGASNFEGNYIKDGNYKVAFTAAMSSRISTVCGMEDDLTNETISIKVTTNTDTSVLNKKVVLCWEDTNNCTTGSAEYFETFMYKTDDSVTNIATIEDSDVPGYYSRLLVKMDKVANTMAVEYLSATTSDGEPAANKGIEVLRLYKEDTVGLMMTSFNRSGAFDQAFMLGGDVSDTSSDVEITFISQSPVLSDAGSFDRSSGVLTSGAVHTSLQFTSPAALQTALYGNATYDHTKYYGLTETAVPSFSSFDTVRTAALADTTL